MAKLSASDIGVVLLVGAEAPQVFASCLPSIMTIRTFVNDPGAVADIREGEIIGSALVGLFGFAGAYLTSSVWPVLVSILAAGIMCAVYEYALRGRRGTYDMAAGAAPQAATN